MSAVLRPSLAVLNLCAGLALAGCEPAGDGAWEGERPPEPTAPVVLGGVDLGQPVRALGTEPFWGVDIGEGALTLTGVDRPEQRFAAEGPELVGTTAVWRGEAADGATATLTLIATECSDGMSDRVYPLTARFEAGETELAGCAEATARLMEGPGA
ncbi:MAG TPA: hypothetical protein VGN74_07230 [Brevundimonas sp.]|jgi:uncharacterized membrane protein|uniref:COG3650 family protein n=1 Tax=Brevundimonas sp. TaxID=1871086 RepID=UPI002E13C75F|nr:hypothetical protein [Brevundimonas sp.]